MTEDYQHYCDDLGRFPLDGFLQRPCTEKGAKVLIVGEALAPNGWRKSGQACYDVNGEILKTGKNLNEHLRVFDLNVESCGFTDLAKCYVPSEEKLKCAGRCWPIFERQLKIPYLKHLKLLILLGGGAKEVFRKQTHTKLSFGDLKLVSVSGSTYKVFPIYHPANHYLIYGQKASYWNQKWFDAAQVELNALLSDGN